MSTDQILRTRGALDRVCSAEVDHFAEQIWGRRAWLSRAADLPPAEDLFSARAADELLGGRGLRTPFLRMAADGQVVATSRFTGSGGIGATVPDQVRDDRVLSLFADGATIVLQGLHRTWAPVTDLAARLGEQLGHPVQVNAYITPPQSRGFAPHYDTHDVFVLQIEGHKRWRVHEPVMADPMPDEPWEQVGDAVRERAAGAPLIDEDLRPGDSLYLPRGFIHAATARARTSIHLTFGVHRVTQRDVLRTVFDEVLAAGWRTGLPLGWDPDDAEGLAGLLDDAAAAVRDVDPQRLSGRLQDARATDQRPEPLGPIAQAHVAQTLTPVTRVRLRRFLNARLGTHELRAGVVRVAVTDVERAAIQRLLCGDPVAATDLPGLDPEDATGLVRRLLREGVLVVADDA